MKVLFLDRDGVINEDYGYVYRPQNFVFKDGIFEVCRTAQSRGYSIIVVTNQSGIARGFYSEKDFFSLTSWMIDRFLDNNVEILSVFHCPHHSVNGQGEYKKNCDCRKPRPGMFLRAKKEFNVDMSSSVCLGDKISDMRAAKTAGVERLLMLQNLEKSFSESDLPQGTNLIDSVSDAQRFL